MNPIRLLELALLIAIKMLKLLNYENYMRQIETLLLIIENAITVAKSKTWANENQSVLI